MTQPAGAGLRAGFALHRRTVPATSMSALSHRSGRGDRRRVAAAAAGSRSVARAARLVLGLAVVLAWAVATPSAALAHGPIAPVASSYLAKLAHAPPGLQAKVVDGDLRMWLQVPASDTVVVRDYRGAPYLRFSPAGVAVNQNSPMYYLNQTPAETPPTTLGPKTPPSWTSVSSGHTYNWHDGRLHALAAVALAPGATYVGRWVIPLVVNGRGAALSGGVWHAGAPSLAWFWPIAVLLACVLAARRVRRPGLDALLARALALTALVAAAVGGAAHELHGRPTVSVLQLILLAALLAFVAWGVWWVASGRAGYFGYFVFSFAALWVGGVLVPTLVEGFVLTALGPFVTRAATVTCLACGASLLLMAFRLAERPKLGRARGQARDDEQAGALVGQA